jgi:hypothetical protein
MHLEVETVIKGWWCVQNMWISFFFCNAINMVEETLLLTILNEKEEHLQNYAKSTWWKKNQ